MLEPTPDSERLGKQAQRDLQHAKYSLEVEHYEWACLAAEQAAEKAIKSKGIITGLLDPGDRKFRKHKLRDLLELMREEAEWSGRSIDGVIPNHLWDKADEVDTIDLSPHFVLVEGEREEIEQQISCITVLQTRYADEPSFGDKAPYEIIGPESAKKVVSAAAAIVDWALHTVGDPH